MTVNKIVPPLVSGAVLGLGHSLEFNKQRDVLLKRGYQEHGSIFTIDLALSKGVVLIGPEYQQQFFELTDKQLDTEKAYEFLKLHF
jgi:sterol 14-demethylase